MPKSRYLTSNRHCVKSQKGEDLTLRLSYKNQSLNVAQGNNRCLFPDPHKTYKYPVWAERGLLNVKLVVHIVTTVRYI